MNEAKMDLLLECFLHSFKRDKVGQSIRTDLDNTMCKKIEDILNPEEKEELMPCDMSDLDRMDAKEDSELKHLGERKNE